MSLDRSAKIFVSGTRHVSVMPTNLYGPNDNYELQKGHVLPALIRKVQLLKLAAAGDHEGIARAQLPELQNVHRLRLFASGR